MHYYIMHHRNSVWTSLWSGADPVAAATEYQTLKALKVQPWLRPALWTALQLFGQEFAFLAVRAALTHSGGIQHVWYQYDSPSRASKGWDRITPAAAHRFGIPSSVVAFLETEKP